MSSRRSFIPWLFCFLLLALTTLVHGEAPITYVESAKLWILSAQTCTYVVGVNERGELQSVYWGSPIARAEDFTGVHSDPGHASFDVSATTTPQEYPGWGAGLYSEPALKVTFGNGNREVHLQYAQHVIDGNTLYIDLKDEGSALKVRLTYTVYPDVGIIGRSSHLENLTQEPVMVESAQSATWTLEAHDDYRLTYLNGNWAQEWQLHSEAIQAGTHILESRRGSTGHQVAPWFTISRPQTTEEGGPVWFGALGWSGSWKISVEQIVTTRQVRVTGGYNTFDFAYRLRPKESLDTPVFYAGFTNKGMGQASRALHDFQRAYILPKGPDRRVRPILYNSWEATGFSVNEAGQIGLAEKAATLGIERFVIDDGWFGARNSDHAGLGDWWVNKTKFPNGLKPVIDRVRSLGMDFGIWVEPEMVNLDSDLYRQHPDWAMNFPGRARTMARNQLVLNLARDDVKEYVFAALDKLLSENDIAFLKWDYNRSWSEPGWPEAPLEDQKKLWVRYVLNLYDIIDRLRAKHPKLEIEACSGGGGRVDLGILRRTEEVWPSDNTDAQDRLYIQDGFTHAYAPDVMMAWVTDSPNGFDHRTIPLKFRFLVAMNGSLGIGANLSHWNDEEMGLAKSLIDYYKQIRKTVQQGHLYRLAPPSDNGAVANEYVSPDGNQVLLFAFLVTQHLASDYPVIHLRGLDETTLYRLRPLDPGQLRDHADLLSGAYFDASRRVTAATRKLR